MSFPKIVAFDTDWTLWENDTDPNRWSWGQKAPRRPNLEDNMDRVDSRTIRDITDPQSVWIRVYGDVSRVMNDILRNGAQLAIVAQTNKALSDRALYYFNTINPADNKEWSIVHLVKYNEVGDFATTPTFRRIIDWSKADPTDILHFDDNGARNCARIEAATTFKWCVTEVSPGVNRRGLTWDIYQEALNHWRRVKDLTIPSNPNPPPERRVIGYSGLSKEWINRVNVRKEGIVDPQFPYRWGYALYVTDDLEMARFYVRWEERENREAFVNEVWVNDYAKWVRLNKFWIPQFNGWSMGLGQMDNMTWNDKGSGENQEARDREIEKYGVKTPYVLFCRHHEMLDMPPPMAGDDPKSRTTEMVVYTHTHRALIEVKTLTSQEVDKLIAKNRMPSGAFHHRIAEWNITVPQVTRDEYPAFFAMAH